jgi:hypothetical protein
MVRAIFAIESLAYWRLADKRWGGEKTSKCLHVRVPESCKVDQDSPGFKVILEGFWWGTPDTPAFFKKSADPVDRKRVVKRSWCKKRQESENRIV